MIYTAGKITITTAITGVLVFLTVFLFDVGKTHYDTVIAQTATTTLTVRNLPPVWVVEAYELTGTATNTPLNTGETMQWAAEATNNHDYWLLICSTSATPTAVAATNPGDVGNPANAPTCAGGAAGTWAVSDPTSSGDMAVASLVTNEDPPFAEANDWWGWVCDDDNEDPRCSLTFSQGLSATNSSPFILNFRPILSSVTNDSPALPGETVTWTSDSSDPDTLRGDDQLTLHICTTNAFSATSSSCVGDTLATTSPTVTANATAAYNLPDPFQDFTYQAFAFLVDEFGHVALDSFQSDFDVANATPTVTASTISLNDGDPMVLGQPLGTTTGFTLGFTVSDANSCIALDTNGDPLGPGSEFADVLVAVYREGVGTTTCDGSATAFDANNCYTSDAAVEWDFTCTQDASSCLSNTDTTTAYECTFSLWHIADPTDGTQPSEVQFPNESWFAAVSVIDKLGATSTFTVNPSGGVDVTSYTAFDLQTAAIPYGTLEPGENTGTLAATTTVVATGNTGIDQNLRGTDMCRPDDLNIASPYEEACDDAPANAVIDVTFQEFGTSTTTYGSGISLGHTDTLLNLQVPKSTSRFAAADGNVYWGIAVPMSIEVAGAYTGQNNFMAVVSDATTW